jgi:nucleotide-binding universal stress UspA family protein
LQIASRESDRLAAREEGVMKVLIGIDDSPHSQAALGMAKSFPWPKDTSFIVLSAAPIGAMAYVAVESAGSALYDAQREQVRIHEELAARVERELREAGLNTVGRVEPGDPRDAIVRVAEAERVDLVIVGSHGRTGLPRLLVGSVASYVVTHAPCDVMVVKRSPAIPGKTD